MKDVAYWTKELALLPHPEGGFYKETYRSSHTVLDRNGNKRPASTGIYFLITSGNFSAFHKIESDEMWHFHAGTPLSVYVILPNGELEVLKIGPNPEQGEQLQAVVPAGCWFASRVDKENSFSLVGCTVSPGFDFADFVLAERESLTHQYPNHQDIIAQLTRK